MGMIVHPKNKLIPFHLIVSSCMSFHSLIRVLTPTGSSLTQHFSFSSFFSSNNSQSKNIFLIFGLQLPGHTQLSVLPLFLVSFIVLVLQKPNLHGPLLFRPFKCPITHKNHIAQWGMPKPHTNTQIRADRTTLFPFQRARSCLTQ